MTIPEEKRGTFKIYRLYRLADESVGSVQEFIITAKTDQAARELACDSVKPEDSCVWLDRRKSRCDELGKVIDRFRDTQIIAMYHIN